MQENHVMKNNSVIDALRLNLDLTKNFLTFLNISFAILSKTFTLYTYKFST